MGDVGAREGQTTGLKCVTRRALSSDALTFEQSHPEMLPQNSPRIELGNPQVSIFDAVGCTISVLFIPTLPPMQRRCRRAASRGKALDYAAVVLFIFADIAEFIMASKVVPAAALSGAPGVSAWQSTASVTL